APDLVGEHHAARALVARKPRAHPVVERRRVGWVVADGRHDCGHELAPLVVGYAHDDGVADAGVLLEHLLHLLGPDLLATRVDAVRSAPEQHERAVGVEPRLVAGNRVGDAVDLAERRRSAGRVLVVADRARRVHREYADLARAGAHVAVAVGEEPGVRTEREACRLALAGGGGARDREAY